MLNKLVLVSEFTKAEFNPLKKTKWSYINLATHNSAESKPNYFCRAFIN